jgi:hypothetical protein
VITESSCLARCVLVILERYFSAAVYGVIDLIHEIEGAFICGLGGICEIQMAGIFVRFILALKAHELFDEVAGLSGRNEVRRGNGVDEDLDLFRPQLAVAEIVGIAFAHDSTDIVSLIAEGDFEMFEYLDDCSDIYDYM